MSVHSNRTTKTSYRTVSVASSPQPVLASTVPSSGSVSSSGSLSSSGLVSSSRLVSSSGLVSSVQPAVQHTALNGSYETMRYLVPVQQQQLRAQQQSFVPVQQQQRSFVSVQPQQQSFVPVQQQSFIPVQQHQQQSYYIMQQPMVQPMVQQVVAPMYVQTLPRLNNSRMESSDVTVHLQSPERISSRKSSVFSQSSSLIETGAPSAEEEVENMEVFPQGE